MARARIKPTKQGLRTKFRSIRMLICDVDGVMTDGAVYISSREETKRFHVPDGLAIKGWQKLGLPVAWVSARPSSATTKRANELKIDYLVQTKHGKVPAVEKLLEKTGLAWNQIAFIGDDLLDLAVMGKAGVAVSPANGCHEARSIAHYVTKASGGNGAVRELIENILKAQGKWERLITEFAR